MTHDDGVAMAADALDDARPDAAASSGSGSDGTASGGVDMFLLQRRLIRLGRLLDGRRGADLRVHGLTSVQSGVLLYFASHPGTSCRDLSARMQVTHQAVQKVVSRLRAKGLLEVVVSARDGREHEVSVTTQGGRLAHELAGHGEDAGRDVLGVLSDAERLELAGMVDRMITGLERTVRRDASDGPDRRDDLLSGSEESR